MRSKSFIKQFKIKFWISNSKRDYRCDYCKKLLQRRDMYFVFPTGYSVSFDRVCDKCVLTAVEDLKKIISNKEELYNQFIKNKIMESLGK
jgi:hypothetical protein